MKQIFPRNATTLKIKLLCFARFGSHKLFVFNYQRKFNIHDFLLGLLYILTGQIANQCHEFDYYHYFEHHFNCNNNDNDNSISLISNMKTVLFSSAATQNLSLSIDKLLRAEHRNVFLYGIMWHR
jgi:hypothetical protein